MRVLIDNIKDKQNSGFTLIELLVVITIMGLLTAMIVPGANAIDRHARAKMTRETFARIRMAILGAENRFDEYGNPVLGGYVGDVGFLPKLYKMEWNNARYKWEHVVVGGGELEQAAYFDVAIPTDISNMYAQPSALWADTVSGLDSAKYDDTIKVLDTLVGLERLYLSTPIDPMPEDQVYEYTNTPTTTYEEEENHLFALRECSGMLSDGWSKQVLVYSDIAGLGSVGNTTPRNLIFVSGGNDGEINFNNPVDLSLPNNEDNLVMKIRESDWNIYGYKVEETRSKLNQIKEAIIGTNKLVIDGAMEPYGFIADIGNPEPLTGSYVRKTMGSTEIYRCMKTHKSASGGGIPTTSNEYWSEVTGWGAGVHERFPVWENSEKYFQSTPHLLSRNAVYVLNDGTYYRCLQTNTGKEPGVSLNWQEYWEIDPEIEILNLESVGTLWSNTTTYEPILLSSSKYDDTDNTGLTVGWSAPYLKNQLEFPIADSWGEVIRLDLDEDRNIILTSSGPDRTLNSSDDVVRRIVRAQYEARVNIISSKLAENIVVKLNYAYNGEVKTREVTCGATEPFALFDNNTFDFRTLPHGRVTVIVETEKSLNHKISTMILNPITPKIPE